MRRLLLLLFLVCPFIGAQAQQHKDDWANIQRYSQANAQLKEAPTAVFMGNSITEIWYTYHPDYFTSHNFVGRGISGQVTSQMLCRFRADVIDLKPQIVVILGGINDIAQNDGYIGLNNTMDNIKSMAELAKANGIKVILCSVLPADHFFWKSDEFNQKVHPAPIVKELNEMIKQYASRNQFTYVDYWSAVVNDKDVMRDGLSEDSVHPFPDTYYILEGIITPVIESLCK